MVDLNAAKVEDVQAFFKQYYSPNNATLVLVGDFQVADAKKLVTEYFSDIPRVATPPAVVCDQKFNTGAIRRVIEDKNATIPAILAFYRVPSVADADYPALELLSNILGQGESSRLNRVMAREAKAVVAAQSLLNPTGPTRGPGIFGVLAIANQGVPPDSVERLIASQVAKLAAEGVSAAELSKAKNAYRANTISERQRVLNVAESLQFANLFLGDPQKINTDINRYDAVTAADIKRVAEKYLRADNSMSFIITPPKPAVVP
jgi:zinc protease